MKYSVDSAVLEGQAKVNNIKIDDKLGLYILCRGFGEGDRGEYASQLVVEFLEQVVTSQKKILNQFEKTPTTELHDHVLEILDSGISKISHQLQRAILEDVQRRSMGADLVLMLIIGETGFLAHVGGSQIHLLRRGELHQLTYHSTSKTLLTHPLELEKNGQSYEISRLGASGDIKLELLSLELAQDDVFLLSSDSLFREFDEKIIHRKLVESLDKNTAKALIEMGKDKEFDLATITITMNDRMNLEKTDPHHKFTTLNGIPLFSLLDYKEIAKVLSNMQSRIYKVGDKVVLQGDKGNEFFVILSGKANVIVNNKVISNLSNGDYFGELSLIDKAPRSATVKATENLEVLVMNKERFYKILTTEGKISIKLLWRFAKTLSQRLREADILLAEIGKGKKQLIDSDDIQFD